MSETSNRTPIEPIDLRARLLEVEPPDVERLNQLRQEIATMYIQQLRRSDRIAWSIALALAGAGTLFGGVITATLDVPPSIGSTQMLRIVWALFTLSCLSSVIYSIYVLR